LEPIGIKRRINQIIGLSDYQIRSWMRRGVGKKGEERRRIKKRVWGQRV
jgi:hypothetical protein